MDVMDRDFLMVDGDRTFDEFLSRCGPAQGMRNVVVTRGKRIVGVLRVNTNLRRTVSEAGSSVRMHSLMQRDFTIVRKDMVVFDVIARLRRRKAVMGVVVAERRLPRSDDVVGVITKEHIADEVADSVRMYPR